MPLDTQPTGLVFIRNFDQGVIETLGAVVREDVLPSINLKRFGYWIDEIFTAPTAVPLIFNNPEQIFEKKIYPTYLVTRTSITPDLARWHSVKQLEYIAGVSGTESVSGGVSGFDQVEVKAQAWPFSIFYTVSCYARYEHEAIPMLKRLLKVYRPYSKMTLIDSLNQIRNYTVFAESGVQDIGEYLDTSDRLKAYSVDLRVEGELDLNDPVIRSTVGAVINNVGKL